MSGLSIREIVTSEPRLRLVKVLTEDEEGINISRLVREADPQGEAYSLSNA